MYRKRFLPSVLMCGGLAAALLSSACSGGEETRPVSEAQTQTAMPANQPTTVTGCLKAGEASGTFVLTAAQSTGGGETATYQLVDASNVNLQDHMGNRVEVTGTMNAQQEIASRTTATPAASDTATGTAGDPKIVTTTEIEIKRLSVSSVKPLDEKCEM